MNDNPIDADMKGATLGASNGGGHRPDGPNLAVLAIVHGGLVVLALVLGAALAGGQLYPSPFGPPAILAGFFRAHETAVRVMAFIQFGAAVPLAIFAATAYARQLRLGVRVPGPVIGLAGGLWAAGFLALSACVMWVLALIPSTADISLIHVLALLAFITGGAGFATGAGLLIAGLAVPALILRFVPRWFAVAGLVIAACGEVSFVSMVATPVAVLIPVVRFVGIAWLIAMAVLLPRRRAAANAGRQS